MSYKYKKRKPIPDSLTPEQIQRARDILGGSGLPSARADYSPVEGGKITPTNTPRFNIKFGAGGLPEDPFLARLKAKYGKEETVAEFQDPGAPFPNNQVQPIKKTSSVITSDDKKQTFKIDTEAINDLEIRLGEAEQEAKKILEKSKSEKEAPAKKVEEEIKKTDGEEKEESPYNKFIKSLESDREQAKQRAKEKKEQYEESFQTSLAALNSTTAAHINNINRIYEKRINEQERFDELNLARAKAYGLGGGGRFMGGMFQTAMTLREEEASDKIKELELDRLALIDKAKAARDTGEAGMLRESLDYLDKVDAEMNATLAKVEKTAIEQHKIQRDFMKEQEEKDRRKIENDRRNFAAYAFDRLDEYEKDKEGLWNKILLDPEIAISYADYIEIMEKARAKKGKEELAGATEERKERESKATIEQKRASADAARALAEQRRDGGDDMSSDLPTDISSKEDGEKKRKEFVKKHGTKGTKLWEDLYWDKELDGWNYDLAEGGSGGGGDVLVSPDGTREVNSSELTAEQIKEAKAAGWK